MAACSQSWSTLSTTPPRLRPRPPMMTVSILLCSAACTMVPIALLTGYRLRPPVRINQVNLLAWREATDARLQSRDCGAVDRGGLQQPEGIGWRRRMVMTMEALAIHHHPLYVERHAHFREHVCAVGGLIVDTEARAYALVERRLPGIHTHLCQ